MHMQKRLPFGARIPSTGTARRLRALAHQSFGTAALAVRSGYPPATLHGIRDGRTRTVTVELADDIATLYDWLTGRYGIDHGARTSAIRRGWHDRAHWTTHPIDGPTTVHDGRTPPPGPLADADPIRVVDVALGARPLHELPAAHRWIPVRSLLSAGYTVTEVADRTAATVAQVLALVDQFPDRPGAGADPGLPVRCWRVGHAPSPGSRGAA